MLSPANIAANRKTLGNLLRNQMNLPAANSAWSYSQRVEFNKAFAAYVLAHPGSFGVQDLATAAVVVAEMPQQLDETSTSANLMAFGAEAIAPLGNAAASIGQGVLNAASLAKYLIPVAVVAVVGIYLYGLYKRETAK